MMTGLDKLEEFTICSVNEFDLFSSVQFMCCGQGLSGGQPFDRSRRQSDRPITRHGIRLIRERLPGVWKARTGTTGG